VRELPCTPTMQHKTNYFYFIIVLGTLNILTAQDEANEDEANEDEIIDLQRVNVTASPFALKQEDLVIAADSIAGSRLSRVSQSSLGATLEGQAGIHSSSFAPGAGRPIIRGFDGDRIRILQNGTDVFDVSFTSPDHGVAIEPLLTERIEIIRGPASLLFGNAAIGGVVNVIDKTLPRESVGGFKGDSEVRFSSVSNEKAAGMVAQDGDGRFAWSANYFKRKSGDYGIPGFSESAYLRQREESEEHEEEENFGTLENSFLETETFGIGFGWFAENSSYGIAVNQYESFYGVPGGHGHAEEQEEEKSVAIDLENTRIAFRAEWIEVGEFFESFELDISYGDYQHAELEGIASASEVGTVFERNGIDIRLTGVHRPIGEFTGAFGLNFKDESFEAIGEEAFIPSNDLSNYALFLVERYNTDWGAIEFGGRIEQQSLSPNDIRLAGSEKSTFNLSAGIIRKLDEGSTLAVNLAYNERAPNASDLYALGPHIGTQSFEIGNPELAIENSISLDASWRKSLGSLTGELTVFFSDFNNFVFLDNLDEFAFKEMFPEADSEGLGILMSDSVAAEFYGFELDFRFHIIDDVENRLHFDLVIDQTRATNQTAKTNLPRIPTRRFGGRLGYESGLWIVGIGMRYYSQSKHLALNESPSNSYTLVQADIAYHIEKGRGIDLFAIGRNLSDEEARAHTSFVKDIVPMPGVSIELGARIFF
jgi:iron complex outermembrane receptor protein